MFWFQSHENLILPEKVGKDKGFNLQNHINLDIGWWPFSYLISLSLAQKVPSRASKILHSMVWRFRADLDASLTSSGDHKHLEILRCANSYSLLFLILVLKFLLSLNSWVCICNDLFWIRIFAILSEVVEHLPASRWPFLCFRRFRSCFRKQPWSRPCRPSCTRRWKVSRKCRQSWSGNAPRTRSFARWNTWRVSSSWIWPLC